MRSVCASIDGSTLLAGSGLHARGAGEQMRATPRPGMGGNALYQLKQQIAGFQSLAEQLSCYT